MWITGELMDPDKVHPDLFAGTYGPEEDRDMVPKKTYKLEREIANKAKSFKQVCNCVCFTYLPIFFFGFLDIF